MAVLDGAEAAFAGTELRSAQLAQARRLATIASTRLLAGQGRERVPWFARWAAAVLGVAVLMLAVAGSDCRSHPIPAWAGHPARTSSLASHQSRIRP